MQLTQPRTRHRAHPARLLPLALPAAAFTAVMLLAALFLASCSDAPTSTPTTADHSAVLSTEANTVILGTYTDLAARAEALRTSVEALAQEPTEARLADARDAWRAAREPWEQSEAFLFGPVSTEGIDPGIDSWPVNRVDLDAVLASNATLTKEYIDGLDGTLKGFHTIEYLLFGTDAAKRASDLTPRQLEYLRGVAASFSGATTRLRTAWAADGGNYAANVSGAGTATSVYRTQKDALQELVTGMVGICDEVANGKINDPFSEGNRALEESQFSNNSTADFQNNIRSVRNLYLGIYGGGSGSGLSVIVAARDATLDASIRSRIDAAIEAIGRMTPTFGEAITNNKPAVENARSAIDSLRETLESRLLPLIQSL